MWQWIRELDRVLRGQATSPAALADGELRVPVVGLTVGVIAMGLLYGLCMSVFTLSVGGPHAGLQTASCMAKTPAVFLLTLAVTFPSLYVFNAMLGSRLSAAAMLRLLVATLAVLLAVLASMLGGRPQRLRVLLVWVVAGGGGYGAVMGLFGGPLQPVYSAVKVPLLLGVSFALTLPAFAVTSTLAGLRDDFGRAVRATASAQAAMAVVLASVAPFTALWYASDRDYGSAILFNGGMFAVAVAAAGVVLRRAYRDLIAADPRHRLMLAAWLVAYAFIAVQMAWVLRPFVGGPGETTFFRQGAWGNAYVQVGHLLGLR